MKSRLAPAGAALALLLLLALPAAAQLNNLPPEVRSKIAAMGPNLNPDIIKTTTDMMRQLVAPMDGLTIEKDLAYGSDPLQTLDLYRPVGASGPAPVVVYVHGGGFVRGDKNEYGPIYGNVPAYLARHGMLGVNLNYRLAPKIQWPEGAEDVGRAVAWLKENAAAHGGDGKRIILIGHSAGAGHVATYTFDSSVQPKDGPGILAAVLISGPYRLEPVRGPTDKVYYGDDVSLYASRAPMSHVKESKLPLLITMAEFDPPLLATDSLELAAQVCARDGKCPSFLWLSGHNHLSETSSLGTKDDRLGRRIVEFVHAVVE